VLTDLHITKDSIVYMCVRTFYVKYKLRFCLHIAYLKSCNNHHFVCLSSYIECISRGRDITKQEKEEENEEWLFLWHCYVLSLLPNFKLQKKIWRDMSCCKFKFSFHLGFYLKMTFCFSCTWRYQRSYYSLTRRIL
jgi:hypothetical protein